MKKAIFLFLIGITLSHLAFSQPGYEYRPEHAFFTGFMDSILQLELHEDELPYYKSIRMDTLRMRYGPPTYDSTAVMPPFFVGEMWTSDMPLSCELYAANLQGSPEKEWVCLMDMGPFYGLEMQLYIFQNVKGTMRLCGHEYFSTFRNPDSHIDFIPVVNKNTYDIVVVADLYRSVYYNEGLHIIHMENDTAQTVFSEATLFVDHLRDYKNYERIDSAVLTFSDPGPECSPSIQMDYYRYLIYDSIKVPSQRKQLDSSGRYFFRWDEQEQLFIQD